MSQNTTLSNLTQLVIGVPGIFQYLVGGSGVLAQIGGSPVADTLIMSQAFSTNLSGLIDLTRVVGLPNGYSPSLSGGVLDTVVDANGVVYNVVGFQQQGSSVTLILAPQQPLP